METTGPPEAVSGGITAASLFLMAVSFISEHLILTREIGRLVAFILSLSLMAVCIAGCSYLLMGYRLTVREYIDDTEDYVNIQLDNQRNELIQLQLILTIASFAIAINTLIVGIFAMNIPCPLYDVNTNKLFGPFVAGTSSGCFLIFLLMLGYARWKKLLGP